MPTLRAIFHHMVVAGDTFPHVYGRPTDCYCEPEMDWLDELHVVVKHQDMTAKEEKRHGN